jgi:pseudouridylate synthase / pseudouridine kinase
LAIYKSIGQLCTVQKSQPAIPAHLPPTSTPVVSPSVVAAEPPQLVVVGSAAVDITARAATVDASLSIHSTSPGNVALSLGGVGRNVAEAAHRVIAKPHAVQLISAIGVDSFGRLMHDETARIGMRTDGLVEVPSARTAVCNMVLDGKGDLVSGVADMDVVDELKGDIVGISILLFESMC